MLLVAGCSQLIQDPHFLFLAKTSDLPGRSNSQRHLIPQEEGDDLPEGTIDLNADHIYSTEAEKCWGKPMGGVGCCDNTKFGKIISQCFDDIAGNCPELCDINKHVGSRKQQVNLQLDFKLGMNPDHFWILSPVVKVFSRPLGS